MMECLFVCVPARQNALTRAEKVHTAALIGFGLCVGGGGEGRWGLNGHMPHAAYTFFFVVAACVLRVVYG